MPGDFIPNTLVPWSAARQRSSLLETAKVFAPVPTSQHGTPTFRMPPDLRTVDYVFIRHDAHRGPLRPPYDGPFRVLSHGDKCLVVDVGGRPETVSWDRVKPANVDISRPVEVAQPPRRGRPPAPRPALAVETPATLLTPGNSGVVDGADVPAASSSSAPVIRSRRGGVFAPSRHEDFDYG